MDATIASLQAKLGKRIVDSTHVRNNQVEHLQTEIKQQYLDEVKNKRQRDLLAMHGLVLNPDGFIHDDNNRRKNISNLWTTGSKPSWSLEALEESLEKKKENWKKAQEPSTHGVVSPLSTFQGPVHVSLNSSTHHESRLLPAPVHLLPRSIRRCRTEVAAGRPGILVKPKSNPMDGDSSLKYGHGQWWKKVRCIYSTIFPFSIRPCTHEDFL
jgi:hypothetical protein